MKLNVTFSQKDMSFRPVFDTIIPMDISAVSVQGLLDGSLSGTYENDKIVSLRLGAFAGCQNLTKISLPNCVETFGRYTFNECKNVTKLNLQSLARIGDGNYTFYGMESLEEISLPSLTTIESFSGTFWNCTNVKRIELPKLGGTTISTYVFRYCHTLETLILGGAFNPLSNTNAFQGTGTKAPNGLRIYVPDDLVDSYKTATNWATMAKKILPISALEG